MSSTIAYKGFWSSRAIHAISATALSIACASGCASHDVSLTSREPSSTDKTVGAPRQTPHYVRAGSYLENDGDEDDRGRRRGSGPDSDDLTFLATYGTHADETDSRAITTIVKRYYAMAFAHNGRGGCALLYPSLATGLAESRSHPAQSHKTNCAAALSPLFHDQHARLNSDDVAAMVVTDVRIRGNSALAVLGFRSSPEAEILMARDGHAWRINALFDSELP